MGFLRTIIANLVDWGPRLVDALGVSLALTCAGFGLAFALGLVLQYLRSRHSVVVRAAAGTYVIAARGVPILVILYLIYFGLPGTGIVLSAFAAGSLGLALVYGAYLSEVFRAGLNAIPPGQREAALAAGLTPAQTFRLILLPQAIRHMLAPLLINLVSLLKDSSICALIAVPELTLTSRAIMSESFLPLHVFALTAGLYFAMAWPASLAVRFVERRLARGVKSSRPIAASNALLAQPT
ncbi:MULTISPECIES: amino acid ABC transporter permease [Rhizobium]|uniref:Amino-acid ABC transporter permease protein yckA n=1 Tax=Rhizobium favelukesii TaxID=348824 RepID=W6RKD8_9HYPH|nr:MULTISPECIES: amino acid ABC transporter permease [Rhizobium]MCA0806593.1 amino acid ABC transporter permease [Rhizobium sp. T1473]MCS0459796.1 amino acid ABC transporter permease [Rhizobium favelukesii]UFS85306.1 amino acid ABC transporter permease [Rhizobium sp. T136]CDM61324.1 putative amino-acid ABC transporter permease protein yckA [Rhizobium favelukesii]